MVMRKNKFASLLVVMFLVFVMSVGIVSAHKSDSLEEKTGMPIKEFSKAPADSAKKIICDYFTAIVARKGSDGTALLNFKILNTDASDSDDIKVSVKLNYADEFDYPAVEYHVVKKDDSYQ